MISDNLLLSREAGEGDRTPSAQRVERVVEREGDRTACGPPFPPLALRRAVPPSRFPGRDLLPTLVAADGGPAIQPLADLGFRPLALGVVEGLPVHLVGEVVLAREPLRLVVVVGVALAVAQVLHQPGGRVEDVLR